MAFDAQKYIEDKLVHLRDKLKNAKAEQAEHAKADANYISAIEEEIAGFTLLLAGQHRAPDAPPAKTSKK